jgi:hypothetical protein
MKSLCKIYLRWDQTFVSACLPPWQRCPVVVMPTHRALSAVDCLHSTTQSFVLHVQPSTMRSNRPLGARAEAVTYSETTILLSLLHNFGPRFFFHLIIDVTEKLDCIIHFILDIIVVSRGTWST